MDMEFHRTGTWHPHGIPPIRQRSRFDYHSFCNLRKLAFLQPIPVAGSSRFAGYLAIHFPEVAASIDEADFGVLHLEVGALTLATRDAIAQRDWHTVRAHFAFVDGVLETAGTDLQDAIGISYLGHLFYGEAALNYAKARTLLSPRLAGALRAIERHYDALLE